MNVVSGVSKTSNISNLSKANKLSGLRNSRGAAPQSLVYLAFQVVPVQARLEPVVAEKVPETIQEER